MNRALNAESAAYYDKLKPRVLATFKLPPLEGPGSPYSGPYDGTEMRTVTKSEIDLMPFPCIEIVQEMYEWSDANGQPTIDPEKAVSKDMMLLHLVVGNDSNQLWFYEKYRLSDGFVITTYDIQEAARRKGEENRYCGDVVPSALVELVKRLADARHHRYVEQPVSRQVRRAEGLSSDYRSYVVIGGVQKRTDAPVGSLTLSAMLRRHPKLHAVRAHAVREHLRTLRNGEIAVIAATQRRAHVRGAGQALQVKDYIVKDMEVGR